MNQAGRAIRAARVGLHIGHLALESLARGTSGIGPVASVVADASVARGGWEFFKQPATRKRP